MATKRKIGTNDGAHRPPTARDAISMCVKDVADGIKNMMLE